MNLDPGREWTLAMAGAGVAAPLSAPRESRREAESMDKWNLIVDVARCENCHNCVLATKDEHIGNEFPGYAASQPEHGHEWIRILRRVRGEAPMVDCAYLPVTCNHCDDAPCVRAATFQ